MSSPHRVVKRIFTGRGQVAPAMYISTGLAQQFDELLVTHVCRVHRGPWQFMDAVLPLSIRWEGRALRSVWRCSCLKERGDAGRGTATGGVSAD